MGVSFTIRLTDYQVAILSTKSVNHRVL